jgi:quercetin dioxygenase-like cupin family protein
MTAAAFLGLAAWAAAAPTAPAGTSNVRVDTNLAAPLPNVADRRLTVITVDYPPGTSSKPHWHPRSAFVFAYVLSGRIESEVEGEPRRTFGPGESWVEGPGAHHLVSRNASASAPARLLVVFIAAPDSELSSPVPGR